jgi:hypothetical protein
VSGTFSILSGICFLLCTWANEHALADVASQEAICKKAGGHIVTFTDYTVNPPKVSASCEGGNSSLTNQARNVGKSECLKTLNSTDTFAGKIVVLSGDGEFVLKKDDGSMSVVTKSGDFKLQSKKCLLDNSITIDEGISGLVRQVRLNEKDQKKLSSALIDCAAFVESSASPGSKGIGISQ